MPYDLFKVTLFAAFYQNNYELLTIVRGHGENVTDILNSFYRAMHCSAKRGIAIACRPSVCLSVCDVGESRPHRLELLQTNCRGN